MIRLVSLFAALSALASPSIAAADNSACHVVNVGFTPADKLQIVAWVEDAAGNFVETVFITQQTGSYGIGNRPGRFDFNSGPNWPYGRRETTFPVWAHRHGLTFPEIVFQDGDDNDLSHGSTQSSLEHHFCRPLQPSDPMWDAATCATTAFTDKGEFATSTTSLYPPRRDVMAGGSDSASVAKYAALNPFDAVSQATPMGGVPAMITWPAPPTVAAGNYVMWVEVSQEFDFNTTYNATSYPSPMVSYGDYGEAYRGQPSVVYAVPFTISPTEDVELGSAYAGYGDPDGQDGTVRPPDDTISSDVPTSGASRFQLVNDAHGSYRVLVDATSSDDVTPPSTPSEGNVIATDAQSATISFVAPGNDGDVGTATGYDIRVLANDTISDANFDSAMPVSATVIPDEAGQVQTFQITGLLPQTDYTVGIRAYDACRNTSSLAVIPFTTTDRQAGEVDACFIATAAYGSKLANDVEVLRAFRDMTLRSTVFGELAVETYYTFGPEVAGIIGESELLRATTRGALEPIVARVRAAAAAANR
jgi:hypothetical protein